MELDGVGGRCSLPTCRVVDYLPFTCPHCARLLCGDHLPPAAHACAHTPTPARDVPECPVCGTPVPAARGGDPDGALARHIDAGCPRPRRANPVCARDGCDTRDVAPVTCRACKAQYCLVHRLEADHACRGGAGAAGAKTPRHAKAASSSCTTTAAATSPSSSSSAAAAAAAALGKLGIGGGGSSGHGGRDAHANQGGRSQKKLLSFTKRRSRSPGGGEEAAARAAANSPDTRLAKPAERVAPRAYRPVVTFANTPSTPMREKNIPDDSRLNIALHYPVHLGRKSEYWVLNARHSAGKILDSLKLPAPPPATGSDRYSVYAVKLGAKGVNLLPVIVPLRDLGSELLQDGDNIVVEVGEGGLDAQWLVALKGSNLSRPNAARSKSSKGSKCVIS